MKKEKTSGFAKLTKVIIWIMLIATIGGMVMTAFAAF
ncbi:DUF4044 domain-containing protein [Loigolactobacillus binensis]|uniref:DUF4044 domain-containing protein n=1 Tax=Loigolactobacillus binensis TaxID=2559922 RepID=A0ABW3EEW5_9LACO|nr:DUF4044 domain-containing protein [Loigolactobacillus binensis]